MFSQSYVKFFIALLSVSLFMQAEEASINEQVTEQKQESPQITSSAPESTTPSAIQSPSTASVAPALEGIALPTIQAPTSTQTPAVPLQKTPQTEKLPEPELPIELERDDVIKTTTPTPHATETKPALVETDKDRKLYTRKEKKIKFNFENEDLTKIINRFAAKKGINIILPQGALAITTKVTFKQPGKIQLSEAEKYLNLFLDLAGYTMHPQGNFYVITKVDQNVAREPYPLYISVHPDDLPLSDERIRTVFYLSNLKVPENTQSAEPLNLILKDMLSPQAQYLFDPKSNGIVITDKSNSIASAMKIIVELDTVGTKDVIEVVQLYNSTAKTVTELLKNQIVATSQDPRAAKATIKPESGLYFAPNTHIAADERRNTVILMGRENAVQRLKEFIQEYMDAAPESGRSILHVYDLQYLDAEAFARVLQGLIESKGIGAQSTKDQPKFFDGVKVVAETAKPSTAGKSDKLLIGGNRLVIAAPSSVWPMIKSLIQELDKPNLEVIIEVLVVDLILDNAKTLAAQTRLPRVYETSTTHPNGDAHFGIQAQSAQILGQILDNTTASASAKTLDADLLRLLIGSTTSMATTETTGADSGSLIIALSDPINQGGGVWSVLKILSKQVETNVISNPFIVALDNTPTTVINKEIRRLVGNQSIGEGGISTIKQQDFTAQIQLKVTPRISSLDRLNLQIEIDIQDFTSTNINNATRITRKVKTSANLSSGQILALGGLRRIQESEGESLTPILGRIPIIGHLFSSQSKDLVETNLAVFFNPTIVNAKLRRGLDKFSADKIEKGLDDSEDLIMFDGLKDPITRFFFTDTADTNVAILKKYLASAEASETKDAHIDDVELIKRLVEKEDNPLINHDGSVTREEL